MWLPGKRRLWKYYVIRKRSHNYGAFAPFFIGTEHSFAGPDAGRTLLVRRRTKNKTTQKVVYISGGEITHKKYFFAGPDAGRTLLVRRRTKNKTTKRWFIFLVAKSPTKNIFLRGPITGRTLLVRRRTKNKTTQKVVFIFGGPGRTRTDTPCRT